MNGSNQNTETPPLTGEGYLNVRVSTAGGALPVGDAYIRISGSEERNRNIFYLLKSNQGGIVETVSLPSVSAELSQTPGGPRGFTVYDLEVYREGFYSHTFLDVPIFSGITSLQAVDLIPRPPYDADVNPPLADLLIPEREPLFEEDVE